MDEIESKQEVRMDLDLEIELEEPNECVFNLRFQLKNVCNKHYKKKRVKYYLWSLNFAKSFFFISKL